MLKLEYQGQFKRDYKLAIKRGCDVKLIQNEQIALGELIKYLNFADASAKLEGINMLEKNNEYLKLVNNII